MATPDADEETDAVPPRDADHDVDPADVAAIEERHDTSWSVDLEKPHHADDPGLVVAGAIQAVEHTEPGSHVNLVTHGDHGHPAEYLYEHLAAAFDDVEVEYVEQCGCGGYVTRVHVR